METESRNKPEDKPFHENHGSTLSVLVIGTEVNVCKPDSPARRRIAEYGALFASLHIVVLTLERHACKQEQISPNVWVYPTDSWSKLDYFIDVFSLIRKELSVQGKLMADVISAQGVECGFIAWLIARKYKRRLQLQIHDDLYSPFYKRAMRFNRLRYWLAQFLLRRVSCVRVVSPRTRDEIEKRFSNLKGRVSLLPIYVDTDIWKNAKPAFSLKEKYPQFGFFILSVGRLTEEKNTTLALDVLARVLTSYRKAGLIIVGDGPLKRKLMQKAERLGISSHVVFEGWQQEIASYYKGANVLLHTSKYEGYGMTLIEAAACGIPIITSDVGVAGELKNYGAMVCERYDPECFAREILELLNDPAQRTLTHIAMSEGLPASLTGSHEDYLKAYKESIEQCFVRN